MGACLGKKDEIHPKVNSIIFMSDKVCKIRFWQICERRTKWTNLALNRNIRVKKVILIHKS